MGVTTPDVVIKTGKGYTCAVAQIQPGVHWNAAFCGALRKNHAITCLLSRQRDPFFDLLRLFINSAVVKIAVFFVWYEVVAISVSKKPMVRW